MSEEKLRFEAERWYRQAVDDLDAAAALLTAKKYARTILNLVQTWRA